MRKLQEYSEKEKKYMLITARETIRKALESKNYKIPAEIEIPRDCPPKLRERGAVFVTLEKIIGGEKHLRGCIGSLFARQPLIADIIEHSMNAAFHDLRFGALKNEEFSDIEIEVSVLTNPVPLEFSDYKDLLEKLNAPEDGVILLKGYGRATFLPIVWEHFKTRDGYDKERFLSELSLKAYLGPDAWKQGCKIEIYHAILVREDEFK